eukprot:gene7787-647_t
MESKTLKLVTVVTLQVLAAVLVSCVAVCNATKFEKTGKINFKHASFVEVERVSDHDILLATNFQPFGPGKVAYLNLSTAVWPSPQLINFSCDFLWPNKVSYTPPGVVGSSDLIVVPDGFLVPGKSTGSISLIVDPFGSPQCVKLTTDKDGYFYHMVIWRDMNSDGRMDILTARVNKPVFGSSVGELLWLEQPPSSPLLKPWQEHVITTGPEVIFQILHQSDFGGDEVYYVAAAQFFVPKVALYQMNRNNTFLQSFVIDSKCGSTEDIHVIDLDGDGHKELLVNTHLGGKGGAVYSYKIPRSPLETFERTTLASGFPVTEPGPNQASPGFLTPYTLRRGARPSILVAGDGSREAYDLVPDGSLYTKNTIVSVEGVIGVVAAQTSPADGTLQKAFVPNYDGGEILVYTVTSATVNDSIQHLDA